MKRSQKLAYKREYEASKKNGKPFFPYAVAHDLIVATATLGVVIAFAVIFRVEIGEPVNPATTDFVPRPEWYFFFLFELLKIFEGENALTPVIMATFVVPNILMVLLIIWPFIDRGPERRIWRRPVSVVTAIAVIFMLAYLTEEGANSPGGAVAADELEIPGIGNFPEAEAGLDLYLANGCSSCHLVNGVGAPGPGPDLTNEGQKARTDEWQIGHLINPQEFTPGSTMPAFPNFTDQEYQELAVFLNGLGTDFN